MRLHPAPTCLLCLRMDQRMTALERAFQLARSGQVSTVAEIVGSLTREGHDAGQIHGPALRRQLTELIKATSRPIK